MKPLYVDGFLHTVTHLFALSQKNQKEFRPIWENVMRRRADQHEMTEAAFKIITESLLSHRSLGRRVRTWTMVLVDSLGLFASECPLQADTPSVGGLSVEHIHDYVNLVAQAILRSGL